MRAEEIEKIDEIEEIEETEEMQRSSMLRVRLTHRKYLDHQYCGRHIDMFAHPSYAILILSLESNRRRSKSTEGGERV